MLSIPINYANLVIVVLLAYSKYVSNLYFNIPFFKTKAPSCCISTLNIATWSQHLPVVLKCNVFQFAGILVTLGAFCAQVLNRKCENFYYLCLQYFHVDFVSSESA